MIDVNLFAETGGLAIGLRVAEVGHWQTLSGARGMFQY
jgi:hypothetical protein